MQSGSGIQSRTAPFFLQKSYSILVHTCISFSIRFAHI